jgi:hypothetical protein
MLGLSWNTASLYCSNGTFNTSTLTANRIYATAIFVPDNTTIRRLAAWVNLGAALSEITMGIYSDLNGMPDTLLYTSPAFTTTTNSQKREDTTINMNLSNTWVWLVITSNGTPNVRAIQTSNGSLNSLLGVANTLSSGLQDVGVIATRTYVSGNLPTTLPSPTRTTLFCGLAFIGP